VIERLGGEVRRELSRFGGGAALMTELVAAWPAAVGETVAANAWPARLARDGTLLVNAASPLKRGATGIPCTRRPAAGAMASP